jgi:hypothetical protein
MNLDTHWIWRSLIYDPRTQSRPRRNLTRAETILFWALRIYLVFMLGVVVYQILTGAH